MSDNENNNNNDEKLTGLKAIEENDGPKVIDMRSKEEYTEEQAEALSEFKELQNQSIKVMGRVEGRSPINLMVIGVDDNGQKFIDTNLTTLSDMVYYLEDAKFNLVARQYSNG